ncbi:hypothetical protein [Mucilaginibacter dorajii]|uniref:Uncharacterized protein n=1 Tax=Mucilaginibacter dorajii TaxID=692994 RepID=A0ABP7QL63_9SPHI|nr:hypothetical protein [Mucilaginibacter dorajii]MCS3734239.1 hypothetical protein [Mucilaginibacter dorajii]
MAILLPRKPTLICLAVLGPICIVDGIVKKDTQEILAMLVVFIFAIVTLINDRKKKLAGKNARERSNPMNPNR